MTLRDDQVLDLFRELPGHQGCNVAQLDGAEATLGIRLPKQYRELLALDSARLCAAEIVAPLRSMAELRNVALEVLNEDGRDFQLEHDHVVFAWEDIYGFYFFNATDGDDPAVMLSNYYDSSNDGKPVKVYNSLTAYFAQKIRKYLNIA